MLLGPKIVTTHMITFNLWQMTRMYDNIVHCHSGYYFPWRLLGFRVFQNANGYHYYHNKISNITTSGIKKDNLSCNYNFFVEYSDGLQFLRTFREGKLKEM